MRILKFFLFFFVIGIADTSAQYYVKTDQHIIDSLENKLISAQGTDRNDLMNQLAGYYAKYNTEKFFQIVPAADSLSDKLKYKRGNGMALYNYGLQAYIEGDYVNSIKYFHQAINIFEEINDELNLAQTFQRIAVALFYSETDRAGAMEYIFNSVNLFHKAGYPKGEAISCFLIGGGLLRMGKYKEGLDYMNRYFRIADSIGDLPVFRGTAYAVVGDCFNGLNDFNEAIKNYRYAINAYDDKNIEDRSAKAYLTDKLGSCYYRQNIPDSALYYLFNALEISRPIGNIVMLMYEHLRIGNIYFKQKKYQPAILHCDSSLSYAHLLDSTGYYYENDTLKNYIGHTEEIFYPVSKARRRFYAWTYKVYVYEILTDIYQQTGQYKKATELYKHWLSINDSLFQYQLSKEQKELDIRYDTEKKEQRLQLLSDENRLKELQLKQSKWFLMGLGGLVILIILLAFILIRQNKLRNSRKTLLFQQRLLQTQMNPHFLFNSLSSIQNFIIREKPATASDYLSRFAKLVRQILNNSVEEYIYLEDEIDSIENYLELQKVRYKNMFDYTIEVDEEIDPETILIPPMLAQPFIENAFEHGFRNKDGRGKMKIRFKLNDKLIRFEVEDDGVGREKAKKILREQNRDHRSMATNITSERLKVLNKKNRQKIRLTITDLKDEKGNPAGTKVDIDIPFKN